MKRRYADKRPYGEWVKQHAVTMSTVMGSVPESSRRVPPIIQVGGRSLAKEQTSLSRFLEFKLTNYLEILKNPVCTSCR